MATKLKAILSQDITTIEATEDILSDNGKMNSKIFRAKSQNAKKGHSRVSKNINKSGVSNSSIAILASLFLLLALISGIILIIRSLYVMR